MSNDKAAATWHPHTDAEFATAVIRATDHDNDDEHDENGDTP